MEKKDMRADVIIPVYKPNERFFTLLQRLAAQTVQPERIILMNTEREYWDAAGAEDRLAELGLTERCEIHHVTKEEFDHGHTRNLGAGYSTAPYFILMTNDALPADDRLVENLLAPMGPEGPAVSYARQLPDRDADPIERFTRYYNYPAESRVKTIKDLPELGIKTFFASNVCAAYDRAVFDRLGGFTDRTIFNEDMIYAAGLLKSGGSISYTAEARVRHSHHYSPLQQFRRNFDLAVSQADHPEVFSGIRSESEGVKLVKRNAAWLVRQGYALQVPRLVILSGSKYMGYLLGKRYAKLPKALVKRLSMNKNYWK